jgi:hypothetical protein
MVTVRRAMEGWSLFVQGLVVKLVNNSSAWILSILVLVHRVDCQIWEFWVAEFDSRYAHNFALFFFLNIALGFQILLRTSAVCLLDKQNKCLILIKVKIRDLIRFFVLLAYKLQIVT